MHTPPSKEFDYQAKCPKCNHDDVSVWFFRGNGHLSLNNDIDVLGKEALVRNCMRCTYRWLEKCITAYKEAE